MLVIVVVALLAGAGVIRFALQAAEPRREQRLALVQDEGLDVLRIAEFSLIDQNGDPFTRDDLRGQLTVIDFLFTNCPFICPALTRQMLRLQDRLEGTGVRLLSISVDPERDTPERLREYAAQHGADLNVWTFLTGDFEEVMRISEDGLKLALALDPGNPITMGDGTVIDNVAHTGKFVLVGPDLRILGLYTGTEQEDVDRLADRLLRATGRR